MKLWESVTNLFTLKDNPENPAFDQVNTARNRDAKNSVVDSYFNELEKRNAGTVGNYLDSEGASTNQKPLATLLTDKASKLGTFRAMAENDIVSDAIDEIKDTALTLNEDGDCIELKINNEADTSAIEEEFKNFIEIYDLDNNLNNLVKEFLIEGELCWENIYNKEDIKDGIIAVKKIKNESYEFATNIDTSMRVGITILNNESDVNSEILKQNLDFYNQFQDERNKLKQGQLSGYNSNDNDISDITLFLGFNQLTYCNTGNFTPDGLSIIPLLNKTRKPYNQLTLIEDSIIVYRLVRAPERLSFNIDAGTMSAAKAEQLASKLMKKYNTKQIYDKGTGTVNNQYDVMSMQDNYWFVSTNGGTGTKVETVGGTGQALQDLEDLDYFIKKLYKTLKVPFSRYAEGSNTIENSDSISYEEYKFYKFIINSLLNPISGAIKESFITHLKLKDMWIDGLKSNQIKLNFVPPSSYEIYETQRALAGKVDIMNSYKELYSHEEWNSFTAEKQNLMTKEESEQFFKMTREDELRKSKLEWEQDNVSDHGTPEPEDDDF